MIHSCSRAAKSKDEFLARLRGIAKAVPKAYVRSVLSRMREKVHALVASKGYTPTKD